MNRTRTLQAVAAVAVFGLLYATGWLWPLLRITLALCGFAMIVMTIYVGAKLAVKARSRQADDGPLPASDYLPFVVVSFATAVYSCSLVA